MWSWTSPRIARYAVARGSTSSRASSICSPTSCAIVARCSPGSACCAMCGDTNTPAIPAQSTSMSAGCAARSSPTRPIRAVSRPSGALATCSPSKTALARLAWMPALLGLLVGLGALALISAPVAVVLGVSACAAYGVVLFETSLRPLRTQATALREAERRFQANVARSQRDRAEMVAIFEHMADGLLVLDANERIELSNPAAAHLL